MSEVQEKTVIEEDTDGDPGIVFVFESDLAIHNCMLLPSVATVAGVWGEQRVALTSPQPGRRKKILDLCNVCLHVLSGATPAVSKQNFLQWLDSTIQGLTKHNTLVYAGGQREWGFYHHMILGEFLDITSILGLAFQQWGNDCTANGLSCGRVYFVGGSGIGKLTFAYQPGWGPF